jgi:hypothetical protein
MAGAVGAYLYHDRESRTKARERLLGAASAARERLGGLVGTARGAVRDKASRASDAGGAGAPAVPPRPAVGD